MPSTHRLVIALSLTLVGCGASAADTLRGGTWKVATWTYSIDSVFDGHANMPATKSTSTATATNAGTLAFTGGDKETATSGSLVRTFNQVANRGTDQASFSMTPYTDTLEWDPGAKNEATVVIYSGTDDSWNGAWTLTGGGGDVTLKRDWQTDFSPTQHMIEHHVLHLKR